MRKYGFDYLVEKVQVLNEMARFSQFWRSNFPEFENFYLQVQNKMSQHPKAPSGPTLGHKRIEYISRMLFDFLSKDELAAIGINKSKGFEANVKNLAIRELSPEERLEKGTRQKRGYTPGYAEFAPKWADTSFKQQEYMLSIMVKAYEDKALSKKFTSKVLDDDNIDAYFDKNLLKRLSSNFAAGTIAQKEESLGMDLEEVYEIQNKAKALIKKLRKSKKLPRGLRTSIYHADVGNIGEKPLNFNEELYPLKVLQTTLEAFLELKTELIQDIKDGIKLMPKEERLYQFNRTELSNLLNIVNNRINEKKPLSREKIYSNVIDKLGGISDQVREEYDGYYEDLKGDLTDAMKDRYDTVFDMLDDRLLDSLEQEGVINSEDRETLKKWSSISGILQQNIQFRGEKTILKNIEKGKKIERAEDAKRKYEERGKKWEAQKQNKKQSKKDDSSVYDNMNIEELEEKLYELWGADETDTDEIEKVEKSLEKKKKETSGLNESSVMSYMVEQTHRDGFSDNRGRFVDRGFKKPKNYAHWLWLNNQ